MAVLDPDAGELLGLKDLLEMKLQSVAAAAQRRGQLGPDAAPEEIGVVIARQDH